MSIRTRISQNNISVLILCALIRLLYHEIKFLFRKESGILTIIKLILDSVALIFVLISAYFVAKRNYQASSISWNITVIILYVYIILTASHK